MSDDVSRDKEIEQEIFMAFSAFFQLILSSNKTESSEIISDNKLQNAEGRKNSQKH